MSLWKCEIKPLKKPLDQLRVGDKFDLLCSNSEGFKKKFVKKPYVVFKNKKKEFALHLLETKLDDHQKAHFEATSYRAEAHKDLKFQITDGEVFFNSRLTFQVKSVLKPDSQMIGPVGPLKMSYAPYLWWGLGFMSFVIFAYICYFFYRKFKWKKSLEDIQFGKERAYKDFYKKTRKLLKERKEENNNFKELQKEFKVFLACCFRMPFHKDIWNLSHLKRKLYRRNKSYYQTNSLELFQLLSELSYEGDCSYDAFSNMVYRCYHVSEKILKDWK